MSMRHPYAVYRRTGDGRLRRVLRFPGWLPWALALVCVLGAAHIAWRLQEISSLYVLTRDVRHARVNRAVELAQLLVEHERLADLRRRLEPVTSLNAKLAAVTSLADPALEPRGVGSTDPVQGSLSTERRLSRQLSAAIGALLEEVAFQEGRQRQLASILRERALEFAARPSIWPVRGNINSDFGYRYMGRSRDYHRGLDIGVPVGTPVISPADGKVVDVGYESGYGLMVVLEHRHGISTVYAHLKSAEVEAGDEVKRGQLIAHTGMSGRTTGSHLHYEVRVAGQAVDPMNFMLN